MDFHAFTFPHHRCNYPYLSTKKKMYLQAKNALSQLFSLALGKAPSLISPLPASGSNRKYFRITSDKDAAIGAYNPEARENEAFVYLTKHFSSKGLPVPALLGENLKENIYLLEDLGDQTLFSLLQDMREKSEFPDTIKPYYHEVIRMLPRFQVMGNDGLDYSYCYPRSSFDRQSMYWDLNYFKYYFLKLAGIPFDEQALEDDFQAFIDLLLQSPASFFLYRDFQSRNIMVTPHNLVFIDYQGGRKGSPAYDLASLLYDAKADLPQDFRDALKDAYLAELNKHIFFKEDAFDRIFHPYVYIRLMQAMGAYGFRGFYEKKGLFLQSIPYALKNLAWLLDHHPLPSSFKALTAMLHALPASEFLHSLGDSTLTITIRSFSYRQGIPVDSNGHGGGFVFDCRALPNPGRLAEFQQLTGRDAAVIEYLEKEAEVHDFLFSIFHIVDQSVRNYLERNFNHLTVNFGCTGGQHRSVYMAEKLKTYLIKNYPVRVIIEHRELTPEKQD